MQSQTPKALHPLAGRSLLAHVMNAASSAGTDNLAVVVGPTHEAVAAEARKFASSVQIFEQHERRGTAHAVLSARKVIAEGADDILVLGGGIIPKEDIPRLKELGIAEVFGPGTSTQDIIRYIHQALGRSVNTGNSS